MTQAARAFLPDYLELFSDFRPLLLAVLPSEKGFFVSFPAFFAFSSCQNEEIRFVEIDAYYAELCRQNAM